MLWPIPLIKTIARVITSASVAELSFQERAAHGNSEGSVIRNILFILSEWVYGLIPSENLPVGILGIGKGTDNGFTIAFTNTDNAVIAITQVGNRQGSDTE
jgi:hypothetical protein